MNWVANLWTWIVEHPITVVAVGAGLLAVIAAGRMLHERKRVRETIERRRSRTKVDVRKLRRGPGPSTPPLTEPAKPAPDADRYEGPAISLPSFASERSRQPDPATPQGALEIEAGRLAYQIPAR